MATDASHSRKLTALIRRFEGKRILVLGDLMLDHFIRGKVTRISPEAPVPVVTVTSETRVPGGAGNVCNNLAALGGHVSTVSLVGDDEPGNHLIALLKALNINVDGVLRDPERPTTQKCRVIAEHQQMIRYDRETLRTLSQPLQDRLAEAVETAAPTCDAMLLSDYGKGVLTPLLAHRAIAAARRAKIPVTVDPKPEHFKRYRGVDCITPNLQEAWAGMGLAPHVEEGAILDLGRRILQALKPASVLITRGEHGMTLFERGKHSRVTHIQAQAREVFDVTGAGDTVISVLTLALASGASLTESAALSNRAAGIVVGKLGTATVSLQELEAAFA